MRVKLFLKLNNVSQEGKKYIAFEIEDSECKSRTYPLVGDFYRLGINFFFSNLKNQNWVEQSHEFYRDYTNPVNSQV